MLHLVNSQNINANRKPLESMFMDRKRVFIDILKWDIHSDGTYERDPAGAGPNAFSAHTYFMTNPSLSGRGRALKK